MYVATMDTGGISYSGHVYMAAGDTPLAAVVAVGEGYRRIVEARYGEGFDYVEWVAHDIGDGESVEVRSVEYGDIVAVAEWRSVDYGDLTDEIVAVAVWTYYGGDVSELKVGECLVDGEPL